MRIFRSSTRRIAGICCWALISFVYLALVVPSLASETSDAVPTVEAEKSEARYALERRAMVEAIAYIAAVSRAETGIGEFDQRILRAMNKIPRHLFVPKRFRAYAYGNGPLPLGHGQNISQPFIIALMTHLIAPGPGDVIYETGTGAGYQAAIFSELGARVYSVEIVDPLVAPAAQRLARLGYRNIEVKHGDGYDGWAKHAPFDGILIKEALDHVPRFLLDQLKPGGRMVLPLGPENGQQLTIIEKQIDGRITKTPVLRVRFSPFQGGRRI